MKAMILVAKDQPLMYEDIEMPITEAGEILVELKAAALNHRDVWIQKGLYAGIKYPAILGSDGSGKTLDGRHVVLNPSLNWGPNPHVQGKSYTILGLPTDGTFAEYVKVPVENVFDKPSHLNFEEAAAFPLAGLTAFRVLFTKGHAVAGDRVLISGVGGGVALMAMQLAIAAGCEVWVSSGSDEKIEKAKAMGAKGGINYKSEGWAKQLVALSGGFDVIIDSAVGDGFADLINICALPGGRVVFYGATSLGNIQGIKPAIVFWKQISIIGSTMGNPQEFAEMLKFVEKHQIKPVVDQVFALQDANAAMKKMDEGKQFGKLVLAI
ncbi:MAG: zinc-binding dehydrogenase [Saprospiraceae bacterium]